MLAAANTSVVIWVSGHFGGSAMMVMFAGTTRRVDKCQPA
jgi:hypothetical protein